MSRRHLRVPGAADLLSLLIRWGPCDGCPSVFDDDGSVGAADLLALILAWGPCLGCRADLNCDGTVGVPDLLLLLAVWGTCQPNPPGEIPKTVQDCFDKFYPNDLQALIACIEAVEAANDP